MALRGIAVGVLGVGLPEAVRHGSNEPPGEKPSVDADPSSRRSKPRTEIISGFIL